MFVSLGVGASWVSAFRIYLYALQIHSPLSKVIDRSTLDIFLGEHVRCSNPSYKKPVTFYHIGFPSFFLGRTISKLLDCHFHLHSSSQHECAKRHRSNAEPRRPHGVASSGSCFPRDNFRLYCRWQRCSMCSDLHWTTHNMPI